MNAIAEIQHLEKAMKTSDHRLVSFEPSHSWLKRYDEEGTLVIQAGWRDNPTGRFYKDDENPHVMFEGRSRLYGSKACEGEHISPATQRKENMARDAFSACLRPSDHGKYLTVVVSHWDEDAAKAIAQSLKGPYKVMRNGHEIRCVVENTIAVLEGEGAYHLMKGGLRSGKTLLFELGQGTTEEWIIDSDGFFNGQPTEHLSVAELCKTIARDADIRAHCLKLGEQEVNLELIAQALRTNAFGSMPIERWEAIKSRYVDAWYENIKSYLLKRYGTELQSISNIVFSGGGAALIEGRANGFAIIPENPQTASVRGAYYQFKK